MQRFMVSILMGMMLSSPAFADARVYYPSNDMLKQLFSYPNNCKEPCQPNQSLEDTVKLYVSSSLKRDGYPGVTIDFGRIEPMYFINMEGDVPKRYGKKLSEFLDIGELAVDATQKMKADGKWRDDWRMMLPLGLAIDRQKSVQLMHFPPTYVLTRDQDYLKARTTKRWADLLVRNGVAREETDRYQTVIDVAPIAAPSNAGSELGDSYDYFRNYARELISNWTQGEVNGAQSRPLMAFGAPARHWLNDTYGLKMKNMEHSTVTMKDGRSVHVFAANHPSLMWNRIERYVDLPKYCKAKCDQTIDAKTLKNATEITRMDLVAACWQAQMAGDANDNPSAVFEGCEAAWKQRSSEICTIFQQQICSYNEGGEQSLLKE